MAKLVKGGPDLPPALLQAQEQGELILFCGAGVSKPAGLPLFGELVARVFEELGEQMTQVEARLCREGFFDRALDLLERRNTGVRRTARKLLTKDPADNERDLRVHRAILALSEVDGGHRLVTTNFDRLFFRAHPELRVDSAPTLPVPRKHRWRSLVHLHGLIDDADPESRNLVLTSSDFGLVYLVDGWAARFVTELFRNFTVLFLGYSVDDPVMRYLTDALAAERRQGGSFREPFAFAGIAGRKGERLRKQQEWVAKGVHVLSYDARYHHRALLTTLDEWATLRRVGFQSRRAIALQHASIRPMSWQDDEARLVVWALSESSGKIAKAFAELEPAPPIEWLRVFAESGELAEQASLLAMPIVDAQGKATQVAPPLVSRALGGPVLSPSPVTVALGHWLTRHLGERRLLDWVLKRGGCLHEAFRDQIRRALKDRDDLEPAYRKVWNILASDEYPNRLSFRLDHGSFSLIERLRSDPWTPILCAETLRLLAPVPVFRDASPLRSELRDRLQDSSPLQPADLVSADMELVGRGEAEWLCEALLSLPAPAKEAILGDLAAAVTGCLKEVLDWFSYLELGGSQPDSTTYAMPSIETHALNHHYETWTWLIDLVREGLLVLDSAKPELARSLVGQWLSIDYPLFRRLTLFAATRAENVEATVGFRVLTAKKNAALWHSDTKRECMRFLRYSGTRLSASELTQLVAAILDGPSRMTAWEAAKPEAERRWRFRQIGIRLLRLSLGGVQLPDQARERLEQVSEVLCGELGEDEQDEFAVWMGGDQIGKKYTVAELAQHSVSDLAELVAQQEGDPLERQSLMLAWQGLLAADPAKVLSVLQHLGDAGTWKVDVWRYALNGSTESLAFEELAALLLRAPEDLLSAEISSIADWLRDRAKDLPVASEAHLWRVCDRLLPLAVAVPVQDLKHPLNEAVNHPAGMLAEVGVHRLSARSLRTADGLRDDVKSLLDLLAGEQTDVGVLARVIMASQLRFLHAVDPAWVDRMLIPLLSWSSGEARYLWQGFLSQPRADPDLLEKIKPSFIEAFRHLDELDHTADNACRFLTLVSLESPAAFTRLEVVSVLRELASSCLAEVADALAGLLRHLGDEAGAGWNERVGPWIQKHWSHRVEHRSPEVSRALSEVAIEAGGEFDNAVEVLGSYLVAFDESSVVEHHLKEGLHARRFPAATLTLLSAVVPDNPDPWAWPDLGTILDDIVTASGSLSDDWRLRRLQDVAARTRT